jgi:hypothetical protein
LTLLVWVRLAAWSLTLRRGWASRVNCLPGLLQQLKIGRADDNRRGLAELYDHVLGPAVVDFIYNRSDAVA